MPAKNKPNELYITRIFNAPVKTVWSAWADSDQVAQWWGPRGFTLTTHSKDLRTGGHWHYTMHGPDGTDYPNKTTYLDVQEGVRLVYDHGGNDDRAPMFRVTVEFLPLDGNKTQMDMTMTLATAEAAAQARVFIKQAGGDSTWDRFAEYLDKKSTGKEKFVINRSFDAPIDLMYDMWTKPEHFSQWLAPKGFSMKYGRADIRPGGSSFYTMASAGLTMHGRAEYREMEKPRRIVYTQQFCDENENVSRHPLAPTWPETMLTVVEFASESLQRTRVTITWEVVGPATPEEMDTFIKGRLGMTMGWGGSFDKLDAYIASHAVQGQKAV
jgi:uncharacterized protein YndB with AHSA1/START domain